MLNKMTIPETDNPLRDPSRRSVLLMLLGLGLSSGCSHFSSLKKLPFRRKQSAVPVDPPKNCHAYFNPSLSPTTPQRMLILPSGPELTNYPSHRKIINELAATIKTAQICDVVTSESFRLEAQIDAVLQGKFDEREIAAVARRFAADSIALIRINEFRTVTPYQISLSLVFIDTNESVVSCSVDGIWNLGDPATRNAYLKYLSNSLDAPQPQDSIYLQSPHYLSKFIAREITTAIQLPS
ncbi:MAG: hypothetical protein OSA89_01810 [Mariniblastus sp.]|nr:hypothetical protein [Mariniblastus sp.]